MRQEASDDVLTLLSKPQTAVECPPAAWDDIIRVLRSQGLLARVHAQLEAENLLTALPQKVQEHLSAARVIADDHERMIRWEVNRIQYALRHLDCRVVLLKGAAYVMANLPLARGRLVADVDILVAETMIPAVEQALLNQGWESVKIHDYDQYYYRQWMHEIPPLKHALRQTDVDVHHAILPKTARLKPEPERLLEDVVPLEDTAGLFALSPVDRVLHCAAHLFHDGDLDHGLRDLLDIHDLLMCSAHAPDFWQKLTARAEQLSLDRPLFYGLRYCQRYLQLTIPESVVAWQQSVTPGRVRLWLMDRLVHSALYPWPPTTSRLSHAVQRWLLYVRSHCLRMPMHLLIPHLLRKMVRRNTVNEEAVGL